MAGLRAYYNPPPPSGKDELGERALIKGNSTLTPIFAVFSTSTPALAQVFALALSLLGRNINENLQKSINLTLESFICDQEHGQLQVNSALNDKLLKVKNFELYYKQLHMEYYYFY